VEPGTGRVLAYYGNARAGDFDYAGRTDGPGGSVAGGHPAGGSFAPHTLAAALRDGVSVRSTWDCQASRRCSLADAVRDGRLGPLYAVTEAVGPHRVMDAAGAAGVRFLWDEDGRQFRLGKRQAADPGPFGPGIGIGGYAVTVEDQATAMASYAAGGLHAPAHFVTSVSRRGTELYRAAEEATGIGLTPAQVSDLTWVLSGHPGARLPDGRVTALATGAGHAPRTSEVSDAWAVGYTPQLAVAVWVGNKGRPAPLRLTGGRATTGPTGLPALIYRTFIGEALRGAPVEPFPPPAFTGDASAGNAPR
jgi:membrane peptidoglycan carboxypeptidase